MQISDIINGITIKLDNEFPNATIYVEKVPQGFIEPCFVVKLLDFAHTRRIDRRWLIQPNFNIMYFPSVNGGTIECNDISLQIQQALETIELIDETPMLARNTRTQIVEGEDGDVIGHNFMRFDFFLQKLPDIPFMEQLEQYINRNRVNRIG